jgi:hypothetical protein
VTAIQGPHSPLSYFLRSIFLPLQFETEVVFSIKGPSPLNAGDLDRYNVLPDTATKFELWTDVLTRIFPSRRSLGGDEANGSNEMASAALQASPVASVVVQSYRAAPRDHRGCSMLSTRIMLRTIPIFRKFVGSSLRVL